MNGCPIWFGCAKGGLNPVGCCMEGWPAAPHPCIPVVWGKDVLDVGGACQFGPPVLLCGAGAVHWCCVFPDEVMMFPLVKENESAIHNGMCEMSRPRKIVFLLSLPVINNSEVQNPAITCMFCSSKPQPMNLEKQCCEFLVTMLRLANLAGCILLHGPLNLTLCFCVLYFNIKRYNKSLTNLVLRPYCKLRTLVYPLWFIARSLPAWAINRWGKTQAVIYSTAFELG